MNDVTVVTTYEYMSTYMYINGVITFINGVTTYINGVTTFTNGVTTFLFSTVSQHILRVVRGSPLVPLVPGYKKKKKKKKKKNIFKVILFQ